MFVDPCIMVQFTKKIQQDATVHQNFYFIFMWSSTCFGWHSTHHQEPKTALAASGFAYVEGCLTCSCWTLTPPTVKVRMLFIFLHTLYLRVSHNSQITAIILLNTINRMVFVSDVRCVFLEVRTKLLLLLRRIFGLKELNGERLQWSTCAGSRPGLFREDWTSNVFIRNLCDWDRSAAVGRIIESAVGSLSPAGPHTWQKSIPHMRWRVYAEVLARVVVLSTS
jgi:hypothetical protein